MITGRNFTEVVYGNLYIFGGFKNNEALIVCVEKYSFTSEIWFQVA